MEEKKRRFMIPYFLTFNNYYNRIVKRMETADEYTAIAKDNYMSPRANWTFNDGITTTFALNRDDALGDTSFPFDYMLLLEDDARTINSRWYVVEAKYTRAGQFVVSLYRDVIADYYHEVVNAPLFVEKATLSMNDPAIYNSENMTFNQIKTEEFKLRDNTYCPWVAVYFSKVDINDNEILPNFTIPAEAIVADGEYEAWVDYPYVDYANAIDFLGEYNNLEYGARLKLQGGKTTWTFKWNQNGDYLGNDSDISLNQGYNWASPNVPVAQEYFQTTVPNYSWKNIAYDYIPAHTAVDTEAFLAENGKIYKIGGKYFKIKITANGSRSGVVYPAKESDLEIQIRNIVLGVGATGSNITGDPISLSYVCQSYRMDYEMLNDKEITLEMPLTKNETQDAVYDVMLIPAGDFDLFISQGNVVSCDGEIGIRLATEIGLQPEALVLDVQLLPFSPIEDSRVAESHGPKKNKKLLKLLEGGTEGIDYELIKDSDQNTVSVALFLKSKDFSKRLYLSREELFKANSAVEKKVNCECNMMRLTSPNYDGIFEYNTEKIGDPRYFYVYATLKPFQPYMCITPDFAGGLYGANYADSRGLICGGNFSLPRATEQFKTYELNNKNYKNVFNRQIENMEITNKYQKAMDITNAAVGTLQGLTTGAMIGGGGVGGAIGAGVGGIGSAITGAADVIINEQLRNEAMDYTKDLYAYSLGNIRALPNVLTQVGAFDITNKVFPIIEYYTATDTEKEALRNKIKYNGMTVMRIGTIQEF